MGVRWSSFQTSLRRDGPDGGGKLLLITEVFLRRKFDDKQPADRQRHVAGCDVLARVLYSCVLCRFSFLDSGGSHLEAVCSAGRGAPFAACLFDPSQYHQSSGRLRL